MCDSFYDNNELERRRKKFYRKDDHSILGNLLESNMQESIDEGREKYAGYSLRNNIKNSDKIDTPTTSTTVTKS